MDKADFYTIGYQGKSIGDLVSILKAAGVATLIDIRHNPSSRFRPEFSKRNLQKAVEDEDIGYVHRRDLGIPSHVRKGVRERGEWESVHRWYEDNVLAALTDADLRAIVAPHPQPVALMCMEAEPSQCHRSWLATALGRVGLRGRDL